MTRIQIEGPFYRNDRRRTKRVIGRPLLRVLVAVLATVAALLMMEGAYIEYRVDQCQVQR